MKKIEFIDLIVTPIDYLDCIQRREFPALAIVGKLLYFFPFLVLMIICLPAYVIQELVILFFTIFKELLQLLKTLANSLFKLGDTK